MPRIAPLIAHEPEIVGEPVEGSWAVTLSQTLTVGPNTRIEFKRDAGDGYVDVELPRAEFAQLRERLALRPGSQVHLKARRLTRFAAPEPAAR